MASFHTVLLSRRHWMWGAAGMCSGGLARASEPQVVASFSILADMARELAPTGVRVASLVGPDADAHVYKPTPTDARRLSQARMVLVNGLGFEGWMDRLIRVSGHAGAPVVASRGMEPRRSGAHQSGLGSHSHGHKHSHSEVDPHAWHHPGHARRYVDNISQALTERWPQHSQEIAARQSDYVLRMNALEGQLRARLSQVPRDQRRVLVSHDAFGYLGEAFGIDFLAPQGWTTASEPSAAAVGRLIRQVREQRVRALFVENISDPRLVERIAQESGARVGGVLYSDALSHPGGWADTYLRLLEHNLVTLTDTLRATR
jgi:zinc/manganese transport system substrate-binding protein